MRVDLITISYFVEVAWGLSTGFLAKFRARIRVQSKQQSTVNSADYDGDADYFTNSEKEDELCKTVVDNYDLAAE